MLRALPPAATDDYAYDQGNGGFAIEHVMPFGGVVHQLIHGEQEKIQSLMHHHRPRAVQGGADADAGHGVLRRRGIEHPVAAELFLESRRRAENRLRVVYAQPETDDALVLFHSGGQRLVDGLGEIDDACHSGGAPQGSGLEQMRKGRVRLRERGCLGVGKGALDLVPDLLLHGADPGVVELAAAAQIFLETADGILRLPFMELGFRTVADVVVVVRSAVFAPTVSVKLEQAGPAALPDRVHRLGDQQIRFDGVVAVAGAGGNSHGLRHFVDPAALRLAHPERGINGIKIVFADEQHRQLLQGGEVDRFIEYAFLDGAVAQENGADPVGAVELDRQPQPHPDRDGPTDDGGAAHEPDGRVHQMHRAALSGAASRGLAVDLRDHRPEVAALAQVVRVGPVAADGKIIAAQHQSRRRCRRLLSDRQMRGTTHLPLAVAVRDRLLDEAYPLHGIQQLARGRGLETGGKYGIVLPVQNQGMNQW